MTAGRRGASRAAVAVGAVGVVLLLVGCSSDDGGVASLKGEDGGGEVSGGYVDENTANYAACLEGLGLSVHAVTGSGPVKGFAEIENARLLGDSDTSPIGIDGVDRDADVKGCRATFPGAKDTLDTSIVIDAPPATTDDEVVEVGRTWAQCARDAGFAMIADPIVDTVVIPQEFTLDQAAALGTACSQPLPAPDAAAPRFEYQAAVKDAVTGGMDIAPYAQAIEGPIYAQAVGGPSASAAPSDGSTGTP
ncbi:hypothetical protein [Cellulomonas timonensis]|uniref:hypothetical protein n=1 Tax=Cellulomonas timonensis TaxID=1689271 RepID=UPI000AAC23EB|nr:hypothetical protein [Cellulomonas timonensis]